MWKYQRVLQQWHVLIGRIGFIMLHNHLIFEGMLFLDHIMGRGRSLPWVDHRISVCLQFVLCVNTPNGHLYHMGWDWNHKCVSETTKSKSTYFTHLHTRCMPKCSDPRPHLLNFGFNQVTSKILNPNLAGVFLHGVDFLSDSPSSI